ncbi:tyrosine-type recombinase/integrase [Mariniphaga sediminis]|uniref:tyrosine-type recombinase/integrase n=1 Tax=Mariniphaga sediminis TaxID=1628158 RepID=UPI003567A1D5
MSLLGQKTTTSSMDWEQFKLLISNLEHDGENKYCLLIAIGVFTGLRIGDLLQLRYSQFENGETFTIVEKKTKKTRRIKINQDLKSMVQRIKKKMSITDDNQFIFINRYGIKPIDRSWVNVKLKRIFKKYNIKVEGNISSHMFRKTLGNRVLKLNDYSNESIVLLMELLGHSSMAITKKYLGIRESEIFKVYDSLKL